MVNPASVISASELLFVLTTAGLLGMVGQGVRVVAGMKKLSDDAAKKELKTSDVFEPSRFFISLAIGFIAGVIAALSMDLNSLVKFSTDNIQMLLGIAAAGYAGADFVEAFTSRITGNAGSKDGVSTATASKSNVAPSSQPPTGISYPA